MTRPLLPRRRALALSAGALAAPMIASGAARAADEWPNRPVRYVCIFPPGGPTDSLSRVLCQQFIELTGQQFIVENKSGSGGNVGAEAIAKSAPDGYTVGMLSIASHAIAPTLYKRLPFDAEKDFTPISLLWLVPNMLMVRLGLNVKTIPELIALAKANPGKYSFGSAGAGTTPHICGEMLKKLAGIDLLHVPYRGAAPATQDLLAGNVDMMFDNIPNPLAQMRAGKVVGLAVTSPEPSPVAPEIPPMSKFLTGFEMISWGGLCGPAGLAEPVVTRMSELTRKVLESEFVKTNFLKQGATPKWTSPDDTVAFRRAEEKRLAPIVKESGARVD